MVKFTTCEDSRTNNHKISDESIWVVGAAGIDVVANVDVFPKPDDKMRAKSLETFGGGNAANTATTLARLGVRTHLISKIGDDINSNFILNELKGEQVETWGIVKQLNSKSPITLVVVDSLTKTRTCIHHSNIVDLNDESVREFLDAMRMPNAPKIIHSDSRHTLGAIALAKEANKLNILGRNLVTIFFQTYIISKLVSLDMERVNRPHVQELLPLADLIFTNQTFPVDYYAHLSKRYEMIH
jgi:sugar/nucleoside kinase (ribokinase family)